MLEIDPQIIAILAIVACAVSVSALLALVMLGLRLRTVRRTQRRAFGSGQLDMVEVLEEQRAELDRLRDETERLHAASLDLRELLRGCISRVAVVRYDAFDDMGGAQSFSAALLDEHRTGVVVSAINGRSETRCYAKPVVEGSSAHTLSDEEDEAIAAAVEGRPASIPNLGRRRRRAS